MNTEGLIGNLRVLWRVDRIIADIQLRHVLRRSALHAVAGVIGTLGLLMFEYAFYLYLVQIWPVIGAAVALGAINLALALLLVFIAAKLKPDREYEAARQIHNNAVESLQVGAQQFQDRLLARSHAFDALLPGLIVPLAGLLLRNLKKRSAAKAQK